jgi:CRP-like cAMP-binding protein
MNDYDTKKKEVDRRVDADDKAGAVKLLVELVEQQVRGGNFREAEALREQLLTLDDTALTEIIRTAELIEAAKSRTLDRDHLALYPALYEKLSPEETNALFFGMQAKQAGAGEVLYREGESNTQLFFLNQGQLNTFFTRKDKDHLISVLEPGAIAGQDSFFFSSVATTSLAAQTDVHLQVLDFAMVAAWQAEMPGLVDKLEQFCRQRSMGDLVAAKGMERRSSRRIKVEGSVTARLLDETGQPAGKPFRGDLCDLSNTGMAFFINANDRAARTLLGRRLLVRLTIQTPGQNKSVERRGLTVAVNAIYIGDYSVHLRFDKPLKSS